MSKTLCLMLLAACGDNLAPVANDVPPPLGAEPRSITGSSTIVTTDETGHSTTAPVKISVTAQFPRGNDWELLTATSQPDGAFEIPNAPPGPYWIETDDSTGTRQFLWTNANTLDFARQQRGRGDAVFAAPDTTLTIGPLTKLSPVVHGDLFELVSTNLGLIDHLAPPLPGNTTLQVSSDWAQQPLISAAAHDQIVVTQLRNGQVGDIAFKSPVASAAFAAIEQADGANTAVIGELSTPPDLAFDLDWNRSEFALASKDSNPGVGPVSSQSVFLRAQPGATVLEIIDLPGDADLAQPFALKNPYPASSLFASFTMAFPVAIGGFALDAVIGVSTTDLPSPGRPIVPLVTPVLAPTIDGLDLFATHDGVGLTPAIAWQLPARGVPAAYTIVVEKVTDHQIADVATLVVPGDLFGVRLPSHVLEAGQQYYLRIIAIAEPNIDVRRQSLTAVGLPLGYADLYTQTFTP